MSRQICTKEEPGDPVCSTLTPRGSEARLGSSRLLATQRALDEAAAAKRIGDTITAKLKAKTCG